jgi:uncharacterized pyridoxamine 5'-phosphate oxidase family protein
MMRLAGKVKFLDDLKFKERLLEERPFLKAIGTGKPDAFSIQDPYQRSSFLDNGK